MRGLALLAGLLALLAADAGRAAPRSRPQVMFMPPGRGGRMAPAVPVTLSGRVVTADGKPAPRARVWLSWYDPKGGTGFREVTMSGAGAFREKLSIYPQFKGFTGVAALEPGHTFVFQRVLVGGTSASAVIRLQPGTRLTGRMLHPDGTPAPRVPVLVTAISPDPRDPRRPAAGKYLPEATAALLFRATTGPDGRFEIAGLPRRARCTLKPGGGLVFAPGSVSPVDLAEGVSDAGILIAARPGSVRVRVTDAVSGKQAARVAVEAVPVEGGALGFFGSVTIQSAGPLLTDEHGEVVLKPLMPARYRVYVQGQRQEVRVTEGERSGPLEFTARARPFEGRVVDAAGNPVAKVRITVEVPEESRSTAVQPFAFGGGDGGAAATDGSGQFRINPFPWMARTITLRATRGNDRAEWSGTGEQLTMPLELRLRRNALAQVTGRLVRPDRRPIANTAFAAIRWQDAPRIAWFGSAVQGRSDAHGRFTVSGLARDESFSLIGGAPFGASRGSFESPRFTTPAAGAAQELGDVVVHPLEGAGQVFQFYGLDSPSELVDLMRTVSTPTPAQVEQARAALQRYAQAVQAGDVDTLYGLTSRFSFAWSEDRPQFLMQSRLEAAAGDRDPAGIRCLRYVPRLSAAYLGAFRRFREKPAELFNLGAAAREAGAGTDWLFLAGRCEGRVRLVAAMHREQGEWRVVDAGGNAANSVVLLGGFGADPDPGAFTRPMTPIDSSQQDTARQVARQFLAAWADRQNGILVSLASPLFPGYAKTAPVFRERLARRLDEGICPLPSAAPIALEPLTDLTSWEQQQLAGMALRINQFDGATRTDARPEDFEGFPGDYAREGRLTQFRYLAAGKAYAILLARHGTGWKVIEPALPM